METLPKGCDALRKRAINMGAMENMIADERSTNWEWAWERQRKQRERISHNKVDDFAKDFMAESPQAAQRMQTSLTSGRQKYFSTAPSVERR